MKRRISERTTDVQTGHDLFAGAPIPSLVILNGWLEANDVVLHPSLRIASMEDGSGWTVRADEEIGLNESFCSIPKSALLSHRTSSLGSLPSTTTGEVYRNLGKTNHTILHLSLCLLHEIRLRKASRFWGYIQSLPRETIRLPVFWATELGGEDGRAGLRWLKGTEAEKELARKSAEGLSYSDLEGYYASYSSHLPSTPTHPDPSPFSAFLHAFSLVTTRSFTIDVYHVLAMVPFADVLNHSTTHYHTSLASDDFVCHLCGSLAACQHDARTTCGTPERLEHLSSTERRKLENEADTVEMRCEREVGPGEEIWNCYAVAATDARLLVEWGFVEGDSVGSGVTFTFDDLGEVLRPKERQDELWTNVMARGNLPTLLAKTHAPGWTPLIDGQKKGREGSVSADGVVDLNLFAYACLSVIPESTSLSRAEAEMGRVAEELETINLSLQQGEEGDVIPIVALSLTGEQTAGAIVKVLQGRMKGMFRPEWSTEKVFTEMDRLTSTRPLTKLAMTLAVNERETLESTLEKWREISMTARH